MLFHALMFATFGWMPFVRVAASPSPNNGAILKGEDGRSHGERFKLYIVANDPEGITVTSYYDSVEDDGFVQDEGTRTTYIDWGNGPVPETLSSPAQKGTTAVLYFEGAPSEERPMKLLIEKAVEGGGDKQSMEVCHSSPTRHTALGWSAWTCLAPNLNPYVLYTGTQY